jgi:hypothetical protein
MKKIIFLISIICLLCALAVNAKVLVLVETVYYNENPTALNQYISDVKNIEFKNVDLQTATLSLYQNTYNQCHPIWQTICDEYTSSLSSGDTLEGVVMVGEIPAAWSCATGETVPDDRYFMDICDQNHNVYSSDTPTVWNFDIVRNIFTSYHSPDQNPQLDIWVSRIMANQIRGLRNGLDVMDEYTIVNNYFSRVHERMTSAAKVPPRGFVMGGISEWSDHDPLGKLGFTNLNLRSVYSFDFPSNRPANWLLQLVWGPRGGTTLGAFNGTRYTDILGQNHITYTNSQLWDYKTGSWNQIQTNPPDTFGYEWAGINEHSTFNIHVFNQSPDDQGDQQPFGIFTDATLADQWNNDNLGVTGSGFYSNSAYLYNPDNNSSNPWDAVCGRGERAIFKTHIPSGLGGSYRVYINYPILTGNSNWVYGYIHSWPNDYNFLSYHGVTRVFGMPGIDTIMGWHQHLAQCFYAINMTTHNSAYRLPAPDTNFECIHDWSGNPAIFTFNDNDTALIEVMSDGDNLIADAVMLVPTGGGNPIVIDNLDPG